MEKKQALTEHPRHAPKGVGLDLVDSRPSADRQPEHFRAFRS